MNVEKLITDGVQTITTLFSPHVSGGVLNHIFEPVNQSTNGSEHLLRLAANKRRNYKDILRGYFLSTTPYTQALQVLPEDVRKNGEGSQYYPFFAAMVLILPLLSLVLLIAAICLRCNKSSRRKRADLIRQRRTEMESNEESVFTRHPMVKCRKSIIPCLTILMIVGIVVLVIVPAFLSLNLMKRSFETNEPDSLIRGVDSLINYITFLMWEFPKNGLKATQTMIHALNTMLAKNINGSIELVLDGMLEIYQVPTLIAQARVLSPIVTELQEHVRSFNRTLQTMLHNVFEISKQVNNHSDRLKSLMDERISQLSAIEQHESAQNLEKLKSTSLDFKVVKVDDEELLDKLDEISSILDVDLIEYSDQIARVRQNHISDITEITDQQLNISEELSGLNGAWSRVRNHLEKPIQKLNSIRPTINYYLEFASQMSRIVGYVLLAISILVLLIMLYYFVRSLIRASRGDLYAKLGKTGQPNETHSCSSCGFILSVFLIFLFPFIIFSLGVIFIAVGFVNNEACRYLHSPAGVRVTDATLNVYLRNIWPDLISELSTSEVRTLLQISIPRNPIASMQEKCKPVSHSQPPPGLLPALGTESVVNVTAVLDSASLDSTIETLESTVVQKILEMDFASRVPKSLDSTLTRNPIGSYFPDNLTLGPWIQETVWNNALNGLEASFPLYTSLDTQKNELYNTTDALRVILITLTSMENQAQNLLSNLRNNLKHPTFDKKLREIGMIHKDINNMSASKTITPLGKDVIHKICSGQVVVTLASAIKELVENSLDAGASRIAGQHASSKLTNFDDLQSLKSFGFRGEALSALCQLAKVTIHTCSADATVGTRLEFDARGSITKQSASARARGTTLTVDQLFHNLPVRRRHLTDSGQLAKEFGKAVQLMTAYGLASVGCQLNCTRISKSGEKIPVIANGSASSVKNNIAAIFGQSQVANLTELTSVDEVPEELLDEFCVKRSGDQEAINVCGFISKPPSNVTTPSERSSLGTPGSRGARAASGSGRSSADRQFVYVNGRPCDLPRLSRLITDVWRRCSREALSMTSTNGSSGGIRMPVQSASTHFPVFLIMLNMPTESVDINLTPDKRTLFLHHERYVLALVKTMLVKTLFDCSGVDLTSLTPTGRSPSLDQSIIAFPVLSEASIATEETKSTPSAMDTRKRPMMEEDLLSTPANKQCAQSIDGQTTPIRSCSRPTTLATTPVNGVETRREDDRHEDDTFEESSLSSLRSLHTHSVTVPFSMSALRAHLAPAAILSNGSKTVATDSATVDESKHSFSLGQFRANATESEAACAELSTYFSKSTFNRLSIVGQFNLGFIIARHGRDLFIIDQHASDEKYRFEQLCNNHRFTCQPLVVPQPLQLSVSQEQLLLTNLDVFTKNGFSFRVDESAPCGQQVHLTATPMIENKLFGRPDIEEMLFVLSESYSQHCRPSRLRDILASRSCRSAIMIGTALDSSKMYRIVRNMATLDHPWSDHVNIHKWAPMRFRSELHELSTR